MRVVVAGGTGFIGSAVVAALSGAGHHVVVLTRQRAADVRQSLPDHVEVAQWSPMNEGPTITDPTNIGPVGEPRIHTSTESPTRERASHDISPRAVDGADAVVNLAGATIARRWTPAAKRLILNSRLDATRALVRAVGAATRPPRVFVTASAVGYYGPCGDEFVTESSPPGTDFLADVCKQWEAAAQSAAPHGSAREIAGAQDAAAGAEAAAAPESARSQAVGIRVVTARFGLILGNGGALPTMALPFRLFAGGPLGSGRQWMPWIHIDDCVGLIRYAIENDAIDGPLNVTAPEPVRNKQFAQTLGRVMGRPSFVPAPAFAMRAVLGEMATMVLSGQRAVPEKALQAGYRFRHMDLEAALRDALGR